MSVKYKCSFVGKTKSMEIDGKESFFSDFADKKINPSIYVFLFGRHRFCEMSGRFTGRAGFRKTWTCCRVSRLSPEAGPAS
jgi:hypothetical protein